MLEGSSVLKEDKLLADFKKSFNHKYKFMSIDQLETFKEQYHRAVNQLITRMYKSVFAMYTLFPEFNDFQSAPFFDKAYQLHVLSHAFSMYNYNDLE